MEANVDICVTSAQFGRQSLSLPGFISHLSAYLFLTLLSMFAQ